MRRTHRSGAKYQQYYDVIARETVENGNSKRIDTHDEHIATCVRCFAAKLFGDEGILVVRRGSIVYATRKDDQA